MKKVILMVCILVGLLTVNLWASEIPVGVAWQGSAAMANRVFQGFEQALTEQAPNVQLDVRKELNDIPELAAVIEEFQATKKGMVILRSNGAQLLGTLSLSIPTFIGGCNNPVELGVAESLNQPMTNLTGVTFYIPAGVKLETFQVVYPALKEYILLVEEGHPGSPIDAVETEAAAPGLGLTGKIVFCQTLNDALDAIENAGSETSIIIGSQALLMDDAEMLVQAAGQRPVFAYSERPVEAGALCGVVADDGKLGQMLGQIVAEVLDQGADIGTIPIQTDPAPKLYLNASTVERLQLDIPYEILMLATIIDS